jgi:hypothetical protein
MKRSATVLATLVLVLLSASTAAAELDGSATQEGIQTRLTGTVLDRARRGLDVKTGKPDIRSFEYASATACPNSSPGGRDADVMCTGAIQACAGNAPEEGQGPQVRLYRRELDAKGGATTGWQLLGTTCFPERAQGQPVLGPGQILAAFRNTPFARPAVHIQPEGNLTLVTLPTFFEVKWPTAGFQPGEIDTTTMLGHRVQIRPTGKGYTYFFGDGTSFGPAMSPGGPYPDGDIIHTYPRAGTYDTHIDITYGGEFSVDGGAWITIPDTVLVPGAHQLLTVKTAHARLVTR